MALSSLGSNLVNFQHGLGMVALLGGLSLSACEATPDEDTNVGPSLPGGQTADGGVTSTPGLGGTGDAASGGATGGSVPLGSGSGGTLGSGSTGGGATGGTAGGATPSRDGGIGLPVGDGGTPPGDGGTPPGDGGATHVDAATPVKVGTKPPCLKKPSQVVAIGDSYMAQPVVMVPKIEGLAVTGGALMNGQHYRDYSAPGTTLGSPASPGSIPPQWDQAKAEDKDIKVLLMDGGGNDIILGIESLLAGCLDPGARQNATCTGIIDGCMGTVRKMAADVKTTGVHDVIYFLYPHVPIGGDEILDYSVEQAQKLITELSTETFRFHLIDTRQVFQGHTDDWNLGDGVHANEQGGQAIAKLIWDKMKSECIAQPASSGCCEP